MNELSKYQQYVDELERAQDLEFYATHVVTDFADIWRLGLDAAAEPIVPDEARLVPSRPIEKITRHVVIERSFGLRRWSEPATVTVYRQVAPCTSRYMPNVVCQLDRGHDGFHRFPGFAWT